MQVRKCERMHARRRRPRVCASPTLRLMITERIIIIITHTHTHTQAQTHTHTQEGKTDQKLCHPSRRTGFWLHSPSPSQRSAGTSTCLDKASMLGLGMLSLRDGDGEGARGGSAQRKNKTDGRMQCFVCRNVCVPTQGPSSTHCTHASTSIQCTHASNQKPTQIDPTTQSHPHTCQPLALAHESFRARPARATCCQRSPPFRCNRRSSTPAPAGASARQSDRMGRREARLTN